MLESKDPLYRSIFACALRLLARREHSQFELRQKLILRGFVGTVLDDVLNDLVDRGWQKDLSFAQTYLERRARKGYGPLRIKKELAERGIFSEIIAALDWAQEDWLANALIVFKKKFGSPLAGQDQKTRFKQRQFLIYRGFDPSDMKFLEERVYHHDDER